jgi:DDE superfamily endonuclease
MDIVALLQCLQPYVPTTTLRQCGRIVRALLVMTGRITMLGMSRWTGAGGSYRTIQRFFATVLPWGILFWVFFWHHLYCSDDVSLVAGDDVIVTKAGTCTHGLDRFFASWYGQPVPGLAFFTLSLVSVQARRAFPLRVEQVVRSDAEKAASKATAAAKKGKAPCAKRRPGRPTGSKNKPQAARTFRVEPVVTQPAPPQTRTCAINASGSSVTRVSARLWRITVLPCMAKSDGVDNPGYGQDIGL